MPTKTTRATQGSRPSTTSRASVAPAEPFSVDHFRAYCSLLVLDNGEQWQLEDWQAAVAADFFAGFPQVWLIVPEGNGKTTMMAGLALYHADYTPSAEVLIAASARDQAELMYSQAAGFVRRTPGMTDRFRCYDGYRRVKAKRTSGRIQVMAADDRTGDGVIPTLCLIDELHRHRDLKLLRTWRGKLRKRGGQIGVISTAGEPSTEFEDARAAMKRTATDVTTGLGGCYLRAAGEYAVIHDFSVPSPDMAEDMTVVARTNPLSLVTADTLRKDRDDPTMTRDHWLRFKCNIAVRGEDSAINSAEWADRGTSDVIPEGEPVDVGADFGWKHDTTALVPLWQDGERYLFGKPEILIPPRNGQILRPDEVKAAFRRIHERNPIRQVVIDPDRAAEIAVWLEEDLGVEVVEYLQSNQPMVMAYERFMECLRNDRLAHPRDPEFTEHVLNAVAKLMPDGSARFDRPSQSRSQAGQRRRVIDALIAAAMVLSVAVADQPEDLFVAVFG